MKPLNKRYHDIAGELNIICSYIENIEDMIEAHRTKNRPIDYEMFNEQVQTVKKASMTCTKEVMIVKGIAYKLCDKEKDYDYLILPDDGKSQAA